MENPQSLFMSVYDFKGVLYITVLSSHSNIKRSEVSLFLIKAQPTRLMQDLMLSGPGSMGWR